MLTINDDTSLVKYWFAEGSQHHELLKWMQNGDIFGDIKRNVLEEGIDIVRTFKVTKLSVMFKEFIMSSSVQCY